MSSGEFHNGVGSRMVVSSVWCVKQGTSKNNSYRTHYCSDVSPPPPTNKNAPNPCERLAADHGTGLFRNIETVQR